VPPVFELPHAVIEPSALRAPLVVAIARFIQLMAPLLPLKLMAQSRRGVIQILEAQVPPLVVAIPKFIQLGAPLPPLKLIISFKGGKGAIS
jgi:hypothetical protein